MTDAELEVHMMLNRWRERVAIQLNAEIEDLETTLREARSMAPRLKPDAAAATLSVTIPEVSTLKATLELCRDSIAQTIKQVP